MAAYASLFTGPGATAGVRPWQIGSFVMRSIGWLRRSMRCKIAGTGASAWSYWTIGTKAATAKAISWVEVSCKSRLPARAYCRRITGGEAFIQCFVERLIQM